MALITEFTRRRAKAVLLIVIALLIAVPQARAAAKFTGRWVFTITIPEAPGSAVTRTLTFNVVATPRVDLHGRATITDESGQTFGGVWRQEGKHVSLTCELPCPAPAGLPCATLIFSGKIKGEGALIKKGNVIVMWDTENDRNPALFDTSNGSFLGQRTE